MKKRNKTVGSFVILPTCILAYYRRNFLLKKDYWQRLLWWCALDTTLITMNELRSQPSVQGSQYLPSANEVCEGYVFTRVCLSTGVSPGPYPGGRLGVWLGGAISRPIPRGEGWGVWPGGVSQPILRGEVGVWPGRCWGVWLGGGRYLGPGLGAGFQAQAWGCVSQHALRQTPTPPPPPSRQLLLWTVHILLECILVI